MSRRSPEALNAKLMMLVAEAGPARVARLRRAPCSPPEAQAQLDALLGTPNGDEPRWPEADALDGSGAEVAFDGGSVDALGAESAWAGEGASSGEVEGVPADGAPAWTGDVPTDGEPAWSNEVVAEREDAWIDTAAPAGATADPSSEAVWPAEPAPQEAEPAAPDAWIGDEARLADAEPPSEAHESSESDAAPESEVPVDTAWDVAASGGDFDDIAIGSPGAFTSPPVPDEIALAEEVLDLAEDEAPAGPPADDADRADASRDSGLLSSVKKLFRK
jgi:hypothetical protein